MNVQLVWIGLHIALASLYILLGLFEREFLEMLKLRCHHNAM